ncbi:MULTISPECIES: adenylate/guanylate cyclase domain-containing protein [unclassified Leisingera]|uniref:adenylate/guanylate cyclase domain-containing protein n=1 Tax=unclassified Leisingera TaxID=2614906 RepID=UPI0010118376|nr:MULTISPECIES: adenylate/guanylate cyclase domain-containing protein [unclassified Leisingera]MBQ4823899.1 adenylate/guanylate cyclase domain-containing protein [Leisingera sp. HS039]MCF6431017.1 adenylate/guanylate cyclase domain-containing protein [Leisingera sp. MMG026]QAX31277.1 adenylate/guanylate cyclase domain-containing protein [Leisingera sp. NJS204]QBR38190.1 adenylate/guanylate cyclase domain-containing protein [Leisingera sp. NJS201]
MTDTAFISGTGAVQEPGTGGQNISTAENRFAEAALDAHKRRGLQLAVRARWIALPIIAVFIVFLNPVWSVLYYHGILALLCLNGWFISRVGTVGRSRQELFLIFLDLLIMTIGLVVPNPFDARDIPVAMQYRFDNFQYFFVILAAGTMAYSWRTVIAIGTWTATMWLSALALAWWFAVPVPGLSEAVTTALDFDPELAGFFDPNSFVIQLRVQEAVVFVLVAVTLGFSVRRFNALLRSNASLERERANLSRYFSPNVVDQLSQNDEPLKQVRSENVAVLFIDIVGFTRLSSGMDPRMVIDLLREFHGRMEGEVFRHHGTLDKYLGDGLMATFGTPVAGRQDATNALACAHSMRESLMAWNRERARQGKAEIRAGIGIHYGEALLGDIGSNRLEFAVLGMTVNIAARLENLTRKLQAGIVISETLAAQVRAEQAGLDLLDGNARHPDQEVRGLDQPMTVLAWT